MQPLCNHNATSMQPLRNHYALCNHTMQPLCNHYATSTVQAINKKSPKFTQILKFLQDTRPHSVRFWTMKFLKINFKNELIYNCSDQLFYQNWKIHGPLCLWVEPLPTKFPPVRAPSCNARAFTPTNLVGKAPGSLLLFESLLKMSNGSGCWYNGLVSNNGSGCWYNVYIFISALAWDLCIYMHSQETIWC